MAKIEIEFDEQSLKILKDVPEIHRVSLINLGLSLVSKTGYYQTLTGNVSDNLESIVNLGNIENLGESKNQDKETGIQIQETPKKSTTRDSF